MEKELKVELLRFIEHWKKDSPLSFGSEYVIGYVNGLLDAACALKNILD